MDEIQPAVLRGQTVALRPLAIADAAAIAAAASDSRERFSYIRVPDGVEEAQRYIEVALADREAGRRLPFVIAWNGRVVGSTSIERLGAMFEGVRRADLPAPDGSVRNSAYYSILRAEWSDVRKKLEDALAR